MKLHHKLLLGFSLIALLVGCVGYVAQEMNARVAHEVVELERGAVHELVLTGELAATLQTAHEAVRARAEGDAAQAPAIDSMLAQAAGHLGDIRSVVTNRSRNHRAGEEERETLEALTTGLQQYRSQVLDLNRRMARRTGEGPAYFRTVLAAQYHNALRPSLARYRTGARQRVDAAAAAVRAQTAQADRFLFFAVLRAIGLTLVLGIGIAHTISEPLLLLVDAARRVGRGRLQGGVPVRGSGEVGDLGAAFNEMVEGLGRTTVSRRYFHNVLASMADPLLVIDEAGTVQLGNQALLEALEREREEVVGEPLSALLVEGEALVRRVLAEARALGHTGNHEVGFRRRSGGVLPVSFSAALMRGDEGEVQGVVCVARDVTEQKRVERALVEARERAEEARVEAERAREAAEAVSRMKSNFLANMSHEVRTPLSGIIGAAQVLHGQLGGEPQEMAGIIERAGIRLLSTVNSVLDMARIDAGEMEPYREPLRLAAEVEDAQSVLRSLAEADGLRLETVERTAAVWALADQAYLHRILVNLIGNALKFTEAGGVTVEVDADADAAVLRVIDTGVGISADFLPHLFDDFKQESSGWTRHHEGSGLGLAITKKLVELLGGRIEVASTKGAGTTVTVRLPRVMPEGAPAAGTGAASEA